MKSELPILSFITRSELRQWLETHHTSSVGIRLRLYRIKSNVSSVSFQEVLEEGLCFGWSESKRHPYDELSYLQFFTPRKSKGTTSARNKLLVERLSLEGKMTSSGLAALGHSAKA